MYGLHINKKGSVKSNPVANAELNSDEKQAGKGADVVTDIGNATVNGSDAGSTKGGLININTATSSELDELPGVGEKTAADIIEYRKKAEGFLKSKNL